MRPAGDDGQRGDGGRPPLDLSNMSTSGFMPVQGSVVKQRFPEVARAFNISPEAEVIPDDVAEEAWAGDALVLGRVPYPSDLNWVARKHRPPWGRRHNAVLSLAATLGDRTLEHDDGVNRWGRAVTRAFLGRYTGELRRGVVHANCLDYVAEVRLWTSNRHTYPLLPHPWLATDPPEPDSQGPDSQGPDSQGPDSQGPDSQGPDFPKFSEHMFPGRRVMVLDIIPPGKQGT